MRQGIEGDEPGRWGKLEDAMPNLIFEGLLKHLSKIAAWRRLLFCGLP